MTARRRGVQETATDRVLRMLAMVPYISRRPGVAIAELAAEFGVSVDQVTSDLDLLMVCGLPGYYPDDLIDVVLDEDGGTVSISYDAGIVRPVRLTTDEAVALTVALRALADLPGLVDPEAVLSALAKLEQAAGAPVPAVQVAAADPAPALGVVREALHRSKRLWIRYYTASRDALTEREVDPIRLLVIDGHAYLEGYCHVAESVRRFRVDRIDEARITEEPAQAPLWVDADVPAALFSPDPSSRPVTLLLRPGAKWVAEYYLMDEITELEDPAGALRVRMRFGGDDWLVRLVLSLGGAAVIEDRPDLAAQVAERAAAALAAYPAYPAPSQA
jgi:proteasome accessory factor C